MSILAPNPSILYREIHPRDQHHRRQHQQLWGSGSCFVLLKSYGFSSDRRKEERKNIAKRDLRIDSFWPGLARPTAVEMQSIEDCDKLDKILAEAKEISQPIIIDWMAAWCRKCIYLKPKLEKMAAEYDTKLRFFCVDVNKVPQSLVKRGNISKMPTIQVSTILKLWKDGEMKAEVIGGHKAWFVAEEIREMIQKFV